MNHARTCGVLLALWVAASGVSAQDPEEKPPVTNEQLLQELRQRVEELERSGTRDREQIQELEQRLDQPLQQPVAPPLPELPGSNDLGSTQQTNLFNPAITIFGDFVGSLSTDGSDNALNRFSVREVELDVRAAISPWADGALAIAIVDEIEQEPGGDVDTDTKFELEEAFVDFHTLPGDLAVKVGKFRNAFGRSNLLHTHDLPQVTRPLANVAFFGPEGLDTAGVQLSWLVPNPWDDYMELTASAINADGGEEAPILGGPNAENPAALAHFKWFRDVGETGSVELGGTYLYTRTDDNTDFEGNVFGTDLTYQWLDPEAPDSHSLLLQGELYWARNDVVDPLRNFRNHSFGGYGFAQYQFSRDWYAGVRGDYTEFPDDEFRGPTDKDWAFSSNVTWYMTEFLRLRFEYQHLVSDTVFGSDNADNFFLELTWAYGAHPPHPYWVNR